MIANSRCNPCVIAPVPEEESQDGGGGWRSWFGLDEEPAQPAPEEPVPEPQ